MPFSQFCCKIPPSTLIGLYGTNDLFKQEVQTAGMVRMVPIFSAGSHSPDL
jgi:hypothetical protein